MKDFFILVVTLIAMSSTVTYVHLVRKHKISPSLSTWIIFFLGTTLSLITYTLAEDHDFRSGILNTIDVISVGSVMSSIIIWGKRKVRLSRFEKKYLGGICLVIIYGFVSNDAWSSNIFTQILIGLGYIPTFQKILSLKRNTESFKTWSLSISAGIVGLYPAIAGGNILAVIYALRTIILISILLLVMLYYENYQRRLSN